MNIEERLAALKIVIPGYRSLGRAVCHTSSMKISCMLPSFVGARYSVHAIFDLGAHPVRPRFGAQDAAPQRELTGVATLARQFIRYNQHVRRRHHDDVRI